MKTDEELVKERVIPCLNEMYLASETLFDFPVDFEMIGKYAPVIDGERVGIHGCFYLPKEKYDSLLDKHTKGFRHYWRFPYRSEIYKKGEEFEKLKKAYEENPEDEEIKEEYERTLEYMEHDRLWDEYCSKVKPLWEDYEAHKISLKKCHELEAKYAQEYGCQRRSYEMEKVQSTIMDYSPNCNKEYFEMVKNYYLAGASDSLVGEDTPQQNKFALKDAKAAKVFAENVKTNNITAPQQ